MEESLDPRIFEVVDTNASEIINPVNLDGSIWKKNCYTETIVLVENGTRTTTPSQEEKKAAIDRTGTALISFQERLLTYQESMYNFLDNIITDHQDQPFLVKLPNGESLTPAQICIFVTESEKSMSILEKELSDKTKELSDQARINDAIASRMSGQDLEIKLLKDQVLKFKTLSETLRTGSVREGAKLSALKKENQDLKEENQSLEEENQSLKTQCFSAS